MLINITPHLIDLVFDAALKSFWRKSALRKFLRNCGIPDNLIATWAGDETKRDFLERIFIELPLNEDGKTLIGKMAKSLAEQKSFPDLLNWEDSEKWFVRHTIQWSD